MNLKKAWKKVLALLILMPVLTCCQSLKNKGGAALLGEFPEPKDENGNIIVFYDEETDTVSMPLWYWKKIVRFAVDAKGVE